ncbi:hypothetical protein BHM03_00013312 [Ensete ventricosum]|nr:hypothetical protein BHM03_00013312 [Ensete ventricosum]
MNSLPYLSQLLEELNLKEKREAEMQVELEELKESSRLERQSLREISCDRDKLKAICAEKDSALQSALLDKSNLEAALARANIKERFPVDSNHEKELLVVSNKHGKGDLIMGSMKTDSVDTKDIDRKNEQTAAILKKQGAQLIELEALYKEEQSQLRMYASRVRLILNDPSKNVSSKEVARLKKLVAYWKEQAGKRGEDEELEEIQDERHSKERSEGRVSS